MNKLIRRPLFIIILLLTLCLALSACKDEQPQKQTKTVEIKTVDELKSLNDYLGDFYSQYTFELKNDLDLSDQDWKPIGYDNENSFRAKFKGNGYTISNLTIKGYDGYEYLQSIPYACTGLFGYTYDATIENIKLTSFNISYIAEPTYVHVGGLVGYAYGNNHITGIETSGQINLGTTYTYEQKETLQLTCEQVQYIGGIVGYSVGDIILEDSTSNLTVDNLIASRGPMIDRSLDVIIYEEDKDIPEMEVVNDTMEHNYYTAKTFAGSIAGYIKGKDSLLSNLSGTSDIPSLYSKSAYLGGLFGVVYNSNIVSSDFTGNLSTRVYAKGVLGGIAALIDNTVLSSSAVEDSELKLSVSKSEYQSYACGGLVGYANDFSIVQNSNVINTKVLSNLENVTVANDTINYPVIGGLVGTIRDSKVYDCVADGGGVFRTNYGDINQRYIFTAGMVADVYGNSEVKRCLSSFKAYTGTVAKYTESTYVDGNGKRILRYIKEDLPHIFVGIDAYEENGKLVVDIINEAGDIISNYIYNSFVGSDIEDYSQNYYNEDQSILIDENGLMMEVDGRSLQGYKRLTGMYSFEQLDYEVSSVFAESIKENDQDTEEGWKRAAL